MLISSHLIFYSLKTVVKRNCVQSSYTYADTRRHLRSADRHLLAVPRCRLNTYGRRAFSAAGPMAWNSLPGLINLPTDLSAWAPARAGGGEGHPVLGRLFAERDARRPGEDSQLEHRRPADRRLLGRQRHHHQQRSTLAAHDRPSRSLRAMLAPTRTPILGEKRSGCATLPPLPKSWLGPLI